MLNHSCSRRCSSTVEAASVSIPSVFREKDSLFISDGKSLSLCCQSISKDLQMTLIAEATMRYTLLNVSSVIS